MAIRNTIRRADFGEIEIETPRDSNASFDPKIISKRQTSLDNFSEAVISLYARGPDHAEARSPAFLVYLHFGLRTRTVKIDIGVEVLAIEMPDRLRMEGRDVAVAPMFADHRTVVGFYQSIVTAVAQRRLGLLDQQLTQ